jgi:HD superfamily phosphodiesterase
VQIPTDEEIRALHEKHAPSPAAFGLVFTHCVIVCAIAEQLLARSDLGLDEDLVRAGSLLHDIGVYRLYDAAGIRRFGGGKAAAFSALRSRFGEPDLAALIRRYGGGG